MPGAIAAISAATHGGFHRSSSQSASPVFLCLKSGYLSFVYHRDPGKVHKPCILHIPGKNANIRTEKANLTFSISIYLLSPAQYYYPTSAKDVKEFLPMFRPHQDSNQERAARLTCTTDVNSNRIDVQLPSLICDPTIAKDPKRTPATVSVSNLQGLEENFLSNPIV
jgi:hypothetical protein